MDRIAGQSFNCFDLYIAAEEVARIAKQITGSSSEITCLNQGPKHLIDTNRIAGLGMTFSGRARLESYVVELIQAIGDQERTLGQ